jgi:Ca-activated chloride channel family protein
VKGFSGDGPFEQEVVVSGIRPSNRNAALRYLWARHRIALLADYNRLRPDDERVKEVTHLGLTYNLLTAYTSFVAVDNQKRLKDGKAVTVKQPLPLPEGVSDHAVGKTSLVRNVLSRLTPSLHRRVGKVEQESLEVKQDAGRISPSEAVPSTDEKRGLELKDVKVREGLPEKTVRNTLERHLPSLDRCCQDAPKRREGSGKLVFELLVDPSGRIIDVRIEEGAEKEERLSRCMIQALRKLQLPAPRSTKPITIKLTFLLK